MLVLTSYLAFDVFGPDRRHCLVVGRVRSAWLTFFEQIFRR